MRIPVIALFATTMFAGASVAQTQEVIDNRPASSEADSVMDAAPAPTTETPEERIREYSKDDNEQVITEAQPGEADGVPEGDAPMKPHTEGENAVVDETPGTGGG